MAMTVPPPRIGKFAGPVTPPRMPTINRSNFSKVRKPSKPAVGLINRAAKV